MDEGEQHRPKPHSLAARIQAARAWAKSKNEGTVSNDKAIEVGTTVRKFETTAIASDSTSSMTPTLVYTDVHRFEALQAPVATAAAAEANSARESRNSIHAAFVGLNVDVSNKSDKMPVLASTSHSEEDEVKICGEDKMPENVGLFLEDEEIKIDDPGIMIKSEDVDMDLNDQINYEQSTNQIEATPAISANHTSLATNKYASLKAKRRSQVERPNAWAPPKKMRRDFCNAPKNVDVHTIRPRGKPEKGFREQMTLFNQTFEVIGRIRDDLMHAKDCTERLQTLRTCIQRIAVCDYCDKRHFSESKLKKNNGLQSIFHSQSQFPPDIKADAKALYFLIDRGIYNMNILRGINIYTKVTDGKRHKSSSYDSSTYRMNCNQYGMNHLVNGQWWPTQLSCGRDGAHGMPEAGIHGSTEGGAYSIILSDGYKDEDHGNTIEYCGTAGSEPDKPSRATECMKQSLHNGNEVRVLRSAAMKKEQQYRPERGFRLDGVYQVVDEECVHVETSMWRFTMRRLPGQDPIRYTGPEKRPSPYEVTAFDNSKATAIARV